VKFCENTKKSFYQEGLENITSQQYFIRSHDSSPRDYVIHYVILP